MQICKDQSANLHNRPCGSHRWITIGTYWERTVLVGNWGVPHAIELNCNGRGYTFLEWDHLFWALRQRLNLSALQLSAVASSVEKNIYGQPSLLALVFRDPTLRRHQQRPPAPQLLAVSV